MSIEHYLTDEQDPKTAEKVLGKLRDMLTSGEVITYLAIQKKPAVTLLPDCIAVTSKRIIFCLAGNLGLTTSFNSYNWNDIKEVLFKEEFFGAKFIAVPQRGENVAMDYIPKVQARKLYQFCNEQLEKQKEIQRNQETDDLKLSPRAISFNEPEYVEFEDQPHVQSTGPQPTATEREEPEDELTSKLKRLKSLFEKQLITQEEYEAKKAEILSQI